uniref:Uncharacterized protein n=1 Tax=Solanum tuberosum TaxID=4113 RepID=M1DTC5_SOLTU
MFVEQKCMKAYRDTGKRPHHQYNSDNIPLRGGQSLGRTSRSDHLRPSYVGPHITRIGSSQHVALGDFFYECGEVEHVVLPRFVLYGFGSRFSYGAGDVQNSSEMTECSLLLEDVIFGA